MRIYSGLLLLLCISLTLSLPIATYAQQKGNVTLLRRQLAETTSASQEAAVYLKIGQAYLFKPGENKVDLDSARYFQQQALQLGQRIKELPLQAQAMLLEGQILLEGGRRAEAEKGLSATLQFAQQHELLTEQGMIYEAQAQLYDNENEGLAKKIALQEKAIALYHQTGAREQEATALKIAGDYYHLRGRASEALTKLQQALKIYQQIGFKELQGVYNIMGNVYTQLGNYHLSIKYELLAAETAEHLGDRSLQLSSIYNHIALTYYFLLQDKEALIYWEKAANIAKSYNDAGYMQTILSNMATSLIRIKEYRKALVILKQIEKDYPPTEVQMKLRLPYIYLNTYMNMREYARAKPYYQILLRYHETLPKDDANQVYLYSSIIRYLMQVKQYQQAYRYIKEYDKSVTASGNNLFRSHNELDWFKADSATGNYKSAIKHYQLYKVLSDSVFNADKANQIASLQVKFETEQKDRNIRLLTQKNRLQADTIHKEEIIKWISVAGAALLLLLLGLIYNRYRLKRRSNTELQVKQQQINEQYNSLARLLREKEWLLKEIHHRVKNNLQIVISLLNTQSAYIDNEAAMDAIRNSQHRMHAMSLIHQKLYQTDSMASIDMHWYIRELMTYLCESFDSSQKITFNLDTEPVHMDVTQAVPLGLILNEAVTNAIKYAFTDGRRGIISICFRKDADDTYTLQVADNGVGLPPGFDVADCRSLGMNLMRGLSEQLGGFLDMRQANGLCLTIRFGLDTELTHHEQHPEVLTTQA